jgi:hypothetical protein
MLAGQVFSWYTVVSVYHCFVRSPASDESLPDFSSTLKCTKSHIPATIVVPRPVLDALSEDPPQLPYVSSTPVSGCHAAREQDTTTS